MPQRAEKSSKTTSALKWLEEVKLYASFKKGALKNDLDKEKKPQTKKKRPSRLKNFEITISISGEW